MCGEPMELQLSEKMIKNSFSAPVYQRGYHYYASGHVHDFCFDREADCYRATIDGEETYDVSVRVRDNSFGYSCSCPAAAHFSSPCKHVAALLLMINDYSRRGRMIPKYAEPPRRTAAGTVASHRAASEQRRLGEVLTKQLIDSYTQLRQKERVAADQAIAEVMQVEWTLHTHEQWLSLEMRSGVQRLYVVKKIRDFIMDVRDKQSHMFTAKFSYNPSEHRFTPEDEAVIALLSGQMADRYYRALQGAYMGNYSVVDERQFIIAPTLFPILIKKLQTCTCHVVNRLGEQVQIKVRDNELPLDFHLNQRKDGGFEVDLSDLHEATYLLRYGYILKDDTFYSLSAQQRAFAEELFTTLNRTHSESLSIGKKQIEPFLSTVAPGLRQIGRLSISDTISERIAMHPLHAKVLVDKEDDQLAIELEYHYGQTVVRPFEHAQERAEASQIFIRDTGKEQAVMDILEAAPLHIKGKHVYVSDEEAIYEFLFVTLPQLDSLAEVLLTNAVRTLVVPEQKAPFASIDVDADHNWLDVRFQMDGIEEADIQHILRSLVEKKRYYRLPNGMFVPLDDQKFAPVRTMLEELDVSKTELGQNQLRLPLYRGGQIESALGETHAAVGFGKAFRRFLNRLKNPELIEFDVPEALHADLRDYQYYGYQWLKTLGHYGLGGILADEMGLGKTVQSIAFLLSEKERRTDHAPALIVTPASLIYNWKNELAKFAPDLHAIVASGTVQDRQELFQQEQNPDIWITSYHTLRQDIDVYIDQSFSTLILDEAQTIKNFNTKTAKAVRQIKASTRFALSGTPIENSVNELWSIYQTILPGFFPGLAVFKKIDAEKLAKMIRPFLLRRLKKDVLSELPDKIETVQTSELTKEQKELYLAYLRRIQEETKDSLAKDGFEKSRIKILAGLTRLRQICCHPALFVEDYQGQSGKLDQLREMLTEYMESGRRVLIFSQFTSMLAIIRQALEDAAVPFFYLDGQTPAKERVERVDQFNEGARAIFLLSLKAGNTGLNLTGADTVILYDLWWNPAVEDQAIGRAHRIGQRNVVQVVRLITEGTIEEKIHELQQKKKDLIETVVQSGDQALSRLSEQEIRQILNI